MMALQVQDLKKTYGEALVFERVHFSLEAQEKVGLVGMNGSGKTTLLQCITSRLDCDSGTVMVQKHLRMGYLQQMTGLEEHETLWEAAMTGFSYLTRLREEIKGLQQEMALCSGEIPASLAHRYDLVLHSYEQQGGYAGESMVRGILLGLGFSEAAFKGLVRQLSGGEKTRLYLTALLASQPDILILDEPTNHLDIEAVEWLENYLRNYPGTVLMVSHDRMFLNNIVQRIIALENHSAKVYIGNYDQYLQKREQDRIAFEKAVKKQQVYISKTEAFIDRYRAGVKAKQAAGREKQLQRLERLTLTTADTIKLPRIKMHGLGGQQVIKVHIDRCGYGEPLFLDTHMELRQKERVGLIGPNGSGKSTLLKLTTGHLLTEDFQDGYFHGEVVWGRGISMGYFSQEFDQLEDDHTLLQEIIGTCDLTMEAARTLLGNILFSEDAVEKKVKQLSGGEKARLALLKMILSQANFLILDEPTNHLDLESCAILEAMLKEYEGTLLVVSHDRYFLECLVERIVAVETQKLVSYPGSYNYYLEKRQVAAAVTESKPNHTSQAAFRQQVKTQQREHQQLVKKIGQAEDRMQALAEEKSFLEAKMADECIYSDFVQMEELHAVYQKVSVDLLHAEEEWLDLQEALTETAE